MLATFFVTTTDDVVDPDDGFLSLREAVIEANSNSENDVISLGDGNYKISIEGSDEDNAATGDFDVLTDNNSTLTIFGVEREQTTISGDGLDRLFQVHARAQLSLSGLTLEGGALSGDINLPRRGGSIWSVNARLDLNNVEIRGSNLTGLAVGGAVYVAGGSYRFENTRFTDNSAALQGGVLFARGAEGQILDSVITENETTRRASLLFFTGGRYEMRRTIVTENYSERVPFVLATDSEGELTQMTISDNSTRFLNSVFVANGGSLEVFRALMDRNEGTAFEFNDAQADLDHVRFLANESAVLASDSEVRIHDSRIVSHRRGGVDMEGADSSLVVSETFFSRNEDNDVGFSGREIAISESEFISQPATPAANFSYGHALEINDVENTESIAVSDSTFLRYRLGLNNRSPIQIVQSEDGANTETDVSFERVSFGASDAGRFTGKQLVFDEVEFDGGSEFAQLNLVAETVSISRSRVNQLRTFIVGDEIEVRESTIENGGGLGVDTEGSVIVSDTIIRNNTRGLSVGNFPIAEKLHVIRSQIYGNEVVAVSGSVSDLLIANSVIRDNSTDSINTAIIRISPTFDGSVSTLTISNSVVANNSSSERGLIRSGNSTVNIVSSTFVDNVTGGESSIVEDGGNVTVANSIFWGNAPLNPLFFDVEDVSVRNSAIEDSDPDDDSLPFGGAANGNIDDLPAFVDRSNGDYRIQVGSPTIDAGDNSLLAVDIQDVDEDGDTTEPAPDLDLLDRIIGSSTDMGAFEFA